MGVSNIDSKIIHTIRFPLICLVVCVHSFSFIKGWDINNLDLHNLSGADIYSLFCITFSMTLAHIAVPTFFLLSGFLFVMGLEKWSWPIYNRARISYVIIKGLQIFEQINIARYETN